MPELPEVETVVRGLASRLPGLRTRGLEALDPKLAVRTGDLPSNLRVHSVARIGKEVVIRLTSSGGRQPRLWLCVHLRMTGRLIWSESPVTEDARHLRARIVFDRGNLLFYDSRRFGTLRLLKSLEDAFPPGLDPLSSEFTAERLATLLRESRQEIKPWLIRQDRLIGLGNLYAAEALFAARISPRRTAGSLNTGEVTLLHRCIGRILERAIKHCGTTFSDFRDERGQSGRFRRFLKVYDREGKPCVRCGRPIRRFVQQGRSTFACPVCQSGTR